MTTAFITWLCIAAIVGALMLAHYARAAARYLHGRGHNLLSVGSEREMLYVPGDRPCRKPLDDDDLDD